MIQDVSDVKNVKRTVQLAQSQLQTTLHISIMINVQTVDCVKTTVHVEQLSKYKKNKNAGFRKESGFFIQIYLSRTNVFFR